MKIKKPLNLTTLAVMVVSLLSPMMVLAPRASAAADTCTWTGGGSDDNFSTAANWSGCDAAGIPESGDSLEFDFDNLSGADQPVINDLVGLSVAGISTVGNVSSGWAYSVSGNDITLTGTLSGTFGNSSLILDIGITLGANIVISSQAHSIKVGDYNTSKVFNLSTYSFGTSTGAGFLHINSALAGSGDINIDAGTVDMQNAAGTYSGDITVSGGSLALTNGSISDTSSITVSDEGQLSFDVGEDSDLGMPITMSTTTEYYTLQTGSYGGHTITFSGGVTLLSDVNFSLYTDTIIEEPFTDNGHDIEIVVGSDSALELPSGILEVEAQTTTIEEGDDSSAYLSVSYRQTVIMNGERGSATVLSGGILKGNGTFTGDLMISTGGILAPGLSPGCIGSGDLIINGTYQVELAGTTVCTQYDQTEVTGTVDVNGGTLNVTMLNSFVPVLNNTFVIISNDSTDAVTGTFTGLAQGATFVVSGVTFQISYTGGDGNDVVLTATAVPATVTTPDTGVGSIISNPIITLLSAIFVAGTLVGFRKLNSKIK